MADLPFCLPPLCVSLSSKDQAEMDPADMEYVEEVEEEETGEDENSKGGPMQKKLKMTVQVFDFVVSGSGTVIITLH